MNDTPHSARLLKRHVALPSEHGAWVFLFSPLLIGLFAGGRWTLASTVLVIAALAAFLLRQPVTIAVKAYSGRRSRDDLPAARFWILVYGGLTLVATLGLMLMDRAYVLWLALPGLPVFAWYLWLVSRRAERRQLGVEVVGSGVLALSAPAAYWIGVGMVEPGGWWLFGLVWFQSAASIVHAYLRLEQRELPAWPGGAARWRMARRALLYTSFNLAVSAALSAAGVLPKLIWLPFLVQWMEAVYGTLRPALGVRPTVIGVRQLIVSSVFTMLFIVAWNL